MRYFDLSHTFIDQMPVYPADEPASLKPVASIEHDGHADFLFTSAMHVGTHIDGPAHMIAGAKRLTDFELETFFGRAVVLDARGKEKIGSELIKNLAIKPGEIVLVYTGWSDQFGQAGYYQNYPVLTEDFALELIKLRVKIVGVDTSSPDDPPFSVHKMLLQENILIIENLTNLDKLIGAGNCEVAALPLKIDADSAPVRVIAKID